MHIVLINPEIPQNTGSIARTCAATTTTLNLVGKLGFEISEKRIRRAGLDYWPLVDLKQYHSFEEFLSQAAPANIWLFSKYGERSYHEAEFSRTDALVFGPETKGLSKEFITSYEPARILRIPMLEPRVRSLNLSNAVSIALYEALRQQGRFADAMQNQHET